MKNNKLKLSLATLTIAGLSLCVAGLVSAETYLYVSTSNDLQAEIAETPMQAINQAEDIATHSGVIKAEVFGETIFPPTNVIVDPINISPDAELYLYVSTSGNLQTEIAETPMQAINQAENIDPNSGVMLIE